MKPRQVGAGLFGPAFDQPHALVFGSEQRQGFEPRGIASAVSPFEQRSAGRLGLHAIEPFDELADKRIRVRRRPHRFGHRWFGERGRLRVWRFFFSTAFRFSSRAA